MGNASGTPGTKGKRFHDVWDVKEKLGSGSFGVVRRCIRKKDKKIGAVKIIKKSGLSEKELKNLERETAILYKADHPNCVRMYDAYDSKHYLYLIMELCEGGELFDAITEEEQFNEKKAAEVIKQIALALQYLHAHDIVHRDLKPENVLYSSEAKKTLKLMDFGLAKALDANDSTLETRCGTLHYVAPEVLGRSPYTHKCDLWSLGVILYVLLCGYLPFYHDDRTMTAKLVRRGTFDFDEEDWGHISKGAKDLISSLICKDVDKRIDTKDVLQDKWLLSHTQPEKKVKKKHKHFGRVHSERFVKTNSTRKKEKSLFALNEDQEEKTYISIDAVAQNSTQMKRFVDNVQDEKKIEKSKPVDPTPNKTTFE